MNVPLEKSDSLDQNLLTTGKRAKEQEAADTIAADTESRRQRIIKAVIVSAGYATLAVVAFFAFLLPKLPYDLLSQNALNYLSQQTPFIWKSSSVKTSMLFGLSVNFQGLSLTSKPVGFGSGSSEPKRIQLERLTLTPSLLSSLPIPGIKQSAPSSSFSLQAFQGEASGHASLSGQDMNVEINAQKLNLEKIAASFGGPELDLKGSVQNLALDLSLPQSKASRSNGNVLLKIKNLQIDPAGFNLGMPLPILTLNDVNIQGTIKNGRFTFEKTQLGGANQDLELLVDGTINLRDPVEFSELDLKMKVKFAPKLTQALPYLDGFLATGKRPDGYYGLKLAGNLMNPGIPQPYSGN